MKKIFILLMAVLLTGAGCVTQTQQQSAVNLANVYQNQKYHISFKYPGTWTYKDMSDAGKFSLEFKDKNEVRVLDLVSPAPNIGFEGTEVVAYRSIVTLADSTTSSFDMLRGCDSVDEQTGKCTVPSQGANSQIFWKNFLVSFNSSVPNNSVAEADNFKTFEAVFKSFKSI